MPKTENSKKIPKNKKNFELKFISEFKNNQDEIKPRERLDQYGPESLALWELLAIVLRTGEKHKGGAFEDVKQLSHRLIAEAGFKGLFTQKETDAVQENFNIYQSHSQIIVAISEIARRLHGKYDVFSVSDPSQIFEKFKFLQNAKQEQCFVLHIDQDQKCVYQEMVAMGTQESVQVYPSDVLRSAIWLGAKEIKIIHNHPKSPNPSEADVIWTHNLKKGALSLHQIKLSDHIIIGESKYFSFAEQGIL